MSRNSAAALAPVVESVHVLRAALRTDPRIRGKKGSPMAELVAQARGLARSCSDDGVLDFARLLREVRHTMSECASPAERSIFLDALLAAVPDATAPVLAVSLTHALGSGIRELSPGGLCMLKRLAAMADAEQGPGAVADLDEELRTRPALKLLRLDGLSMVFDDCSLRELAGLCGRVMERTRLLREHGALTDVILFVRSVAEARTDYAVLERELELRASTLHASACSAIGDASRMRNVMVTEWSWPTSSIDAAQGALSVARALVRSAARVDPLAILAPVRVTTR